MAEKVTLMTLKVSDLQSPCCYRKVKKILCKFPQIRDQVYDEKQNLVKITVVCCSPEKFRNELCCMGGKLIKSIEIVKPPDEGQKDPDPKPVSPKNKPGPAPPPQGITPTAVPVLGVPRPYPHVPPPCYDNYGYSYGYSYVYGYFYGYGKGCNTSRCDCVHEENIRSCRCGCGKGCHVSRCDCVHE